VGGRVVRNPEARVRLGEHVIEVGGQKIGAGERIYLMMNKPRGIVTTARDDKGRPTVYSLLPTDLPWVAPVGRLDKASEGLLLLTNDSEWGARIASPDTHVNKTYHVQIATVAGPDLLRCITDGVRDDGDLLRVKKASVVRTGAKNSWLEVVLDEGKNRQIRRLMDALGIDVLRLIRVGIGPLPLGSLAKREVRKLSGDEMDSLVKSAVFAPRV
jgi:23S rRNA pseudouridine2605 synthase